MPAMPARTAPAPSPGLDLSGFAGTGLDVGDPDPADLDPGDPALSGYAPYTPHLYTPDPADAVCSPDDAPGHSTALAWMEEANRLADRADRGEAGGRAEGRADSYPPGGLDAGAGNPVHYRVRDAAPGGWPNIIVAHSMRDAPDTLYLTAREPRTYGRRSIVLDGAGAVALGWMLVAWGEGRLAERKEATRE